MATPAMPRDDLMKYLREMQSRDYFGRKHASAQDPRLLAG